MRSWGWLLVVGLAAGARVADAQVNLIPNPSFDVDVSGWEFTDGKLWVPDDVNGDPGSGSVEIGAYAFGTDRSAISVCVPVTGDLEYAYGAFLNLTIDPGVVGSANIQVQWFTDAACQDFVSGAPAPFITSNAVGSWGLLADTAQAPGAAQYARVNPGVAKSTGPAGFGVTAHFDEVFFFVPEPPAGIGALVALSTVAVLCPNRRRRGSGRHVTRVDAPLDAGDGPVV